MSSTSSEIKHVLVAPLHWGLGHASRCIPIIREQLALGRTVTIAAEGGPRALLESHFPSLSFVHIPFMEITYPANGKMVNHFVRHGWRLLTSIWREHHLLQNLVASEGIDLVISDSRFGLWTKHCHTVFITHQLEIQSPLFQPLINVVNRWVMRRYDEVWVPDHAAFPGLAGKLSHPQTPVPNAKYIGPLSRFTEPLTPHMPSKWKAVAVISGPEPQRSMFEAELVRRFIESGEPALILEGKPGESKHQVIDQLEIVSHLSDDALFDALQQSELLIARSGYSTIMDANVLGIKTQLHPTPGQTEQEYLAKLHGHQS
jgi:hypothetical protein